MENKLIKIITSCKTIDQLQVAKKYLQLAQYKFKVSFPQAQLIIKNIEKNYEYFGCF